MGTVTESWVRLPQSRRRQANSRAGVAVWRGDSHGEAREMGRGQRCGLVFGPPATLVSRPLAIALHHRSAGGRSGALPRRQLETFVQSKARNGSRGRHRFRVRARHVHVVDLSVRGKLQPLTVRGPSAPPLAATAALAISCSLAGVAHAAPGITTSLRSAPIDRARSHLTPGRDKSIKVFRCSILANAVDVVIDDEATSCPEGAPFRGVALGLMPSGT
jgi:hypothetical protein